MLWLQNYYHILLQLNAFKSHEILLIIFGITIKNSWHATFHLLGLRDKQKKITKKRKLLSKIDNDKSDKII